MKVPTFPKEKVYVLLGIGSLMVFLWALQKWVFKTKSVASFADKPFRSEEIRKLPCGRFQKRVVELEGSTGVKIVQLLSPEGQLLKEKRTPIDLGDCALIGKGQFIPDLWKDCQISVE